MTPSRLLLFAGRLERSLWFRPAVFAALAVAAPALAPLFQPYVPEAAAERVSIEDVDRVLGILTSGMLSVAIFSLGTMVSALQAAASAATPRARALISEDRTAQNAISTFIGAFIFSVFGVVGLVLGLFDAAARVAMFGLTLLLIFAVIVALVAWIRRLTQMGGVHEAVVLVEAATARAFAKVAAAPWFRGRESDGPPEDATAVPAERFGWVQAIDAASLGAIADELDCDLHVAVRPGAAVDPLRPLAHVAGAVDAACAARIRRAFVIDGSRTFEQDPRFGLIVLSEIASRALSPAVNDPGTAIDVIAAQVRLLAGWSAMLKGLEPPGDRPRLFAPPLPVQDAFEDAFRAIARDGAGVVEVGIKLQKGLGALAALDPERYGAAARAAAADAAARARAAMGHGPDRAALDRARRDVGLDG
ncbi:MAG: DUF2254 domain-containing protein [Rhodobacteraceae bacterium]|nr:MAG: DUF2254 domain-containing protein [Paracoccaceae bacterium]